MIPSAALLLAAGLGTRMGEIGMHLPKVLFPLFERRLLDAQLLFIKELGIAKIIVNTHHCAPLLESYLKEYWPEVLISHEEELLDVGGAIHQLIKRSFVTKEDRLLVLTGDAFLFQTRTQYESFFSASLSAPVTLLGIKVERDNEYNTLQIQNDLLVGITDKSRSKAGEITYSGISLVAISDLVYQSGPTRFFESVAPYKQKSIAVYNFAQYEYFDFGTIERFIESHERIFQEVKDSKCSLFTEFLLKHHLLKREAFDFIRSLYSLDSERELCFQTSTQLSYGKKSELSGPMISYRNFISRPL